MEMSGCGCGAESTKKFQYECVCEDVDCGCCKEDSCGCQTVGFDEEPAEVPTCCGKPMKKV
jgi:hypothetical protein